MKRIINASVLCFLLLTSFVYAIPSPQDVEREVKNGNYPNAEIMLREIIRDKPNSARAHYNLGQVLDYLGRYKEALYELEYSQKLDPDLKFSSNPNKYYEILSKVKFKVNNMSNNRDVRHEDIGNREDKPEGISFGEIVFMVFFLTGIVLVFYYFSNKKMNKKIKELGEIRLNKLTELFDKTNNLEIDLQSSDVLKEVKPLILERIKRLQESLSNRIQDIQKGVLISHDDRDLNKAYADIVDKIMSPTLNEDTYKTKQEVPKQEVPKYVTSPKQNTYKPPQRQKTITKKVIVNNSNSSDGFLTGVFVGSALGDSHHHNHDHNDNHDSNFDSGRSNNDDYKPSSSDFDSGSSSSSSDWGGGSSFDSGSSSSSDNSGW